MTRLRKKLENLAIAIKTRNINDAHKYAKNTILIFAETRVFAASNTESIDSFINFACDWLTKIGGVIALVGGVMFALGWQREDAEGKSRGLMTLMAGFMLVAIAQSKNLFGL